MSGERTHPHEGAVFQQKVDKAFVHPLSSPWVEYGGTLSQEVKKATTTVRHSTKMSAEGQLAVESDSEEMQLGGL